MARGYSFDESKVPAAAEPVMLAVTSGQIAHEWAHLMNKLRARNPALYAKWQETAKPAPHPMFKVRAGEVESWERQ